MIYKDVFLDWLSKEMGKSYLNGSRTEIISFCPWCEGITNKRHGHLYISTDEPVFYCQRCGEKGTVLKLISYLNGNVSDLIDENVIQLSRYSYTDKNLDSLRNELILKINNPEKIYTKNFDKKKEYLYKRFGKEIELNKIPRLIFSIKDFLYDNNIKIEEHKKIYLNELDDNYIGFLSNKGTSITFRNCFDNDKMRYYKFSLSNKPYYFLDFYGIKTGRMNEKTPNIVLCEGIFDLLVSVFNDGLNSLKNDSIFWASCLGKGSYLKTFNSILNYCNLIKANLYILSDSDVPWYFYYRLRENPCIDKLFIYYNRHHKDFGEYPINDVIVREIKLKIRRKNYVKPSYS